MKEQFSLKKYMANPELKIVTRDGRDAEIIYTDRLSERCVIALVDGYQALYYYPNGRGNGMYGRDSGDDLFFITDDEPSEFERGLIQLIKSEREAGTTDEEVARAWKDKLLELAKKELS